MPANPSLLRSILASPLAPFRAALSALKQPLDSIADPTGQGKTFSQLVKDPKFYAVTGLGSAVDYGLYKGYKKLTEDPAERRLNSLGDALAPISYVLGLDDADKKRSGLATAAILASPLIGAALDGQKGFGQGIGASAGSLTGYHAGKHLGELIAEGNIIEGLNEDKKNLARLAAIAGTTALGGLSGIHLANKLNNND